MYSETYWTTQLRGEATTTGGESQADEEKKSGCSCVGWGASAGMPPPSHSGSPVHVKPLENKITAFHSILIVF